MAVSVRIPTPLRKLTQDADTVSGEGATIAEVLGDLNNQFPGLKERLYDESGALRRFVNVYLNDEDIRFLNGDATEVKAGDELSIVPAIAGGC
ncbi:MAG: molybdopterin synthase sulfur carrier subunit [Alphaproteobacteria bacterium CG_4_10_14_0_2_um_filter_63_37]|nr:MAG: molybdopterin synthase sulfur carrier subunit [Proteobacteria bacterium CG1_02_64_396]PJA24002.1 MAG: molybdopterin synthase sulfur carrier subunit [Alphaproteobacteria bacterium CG_4_10_14_0_2_um_filter_63_37]